MELMISRALSWLHAPRSWAIGLLAMILGPPLACIAVIVFIYEAQLFPVGRLAMWVPTGVGIAACQLLPTRHVLTRIAVAVPYAFLVYMTIIYFGFIAVCALYSDCV
ncbi:hypothetical protein [Microvirga solisilvae]|uniref:hypothetical protein n=1 Tax=Microvirga solisilvae TaxID=2919498 RepID=UPI001FAF651A|nr:hypothetical protein [Microvirga solisilvae]